MHPVVGGIAAIGDEGKVTGTLAALVTSPPSGRSMEEMSWELGEVPGRGDESSHRAAEARSHLRQTRASGQVSDASVRLKWSILSRIDHAQG